jgi:bifunctional UDP-N-acetylglucosamine pyrophosphorylase / glucosamine-1-phosphate N-acetyltransferase
VHIINGSKIGKNCNIEAFSIINNSIIGDNVTVRSNSVITDSTIENNCNIGPFAHIEGDATIQEMAVIGNFVQVKKSKIGTKTKAKHLSFIGNSVIGNNVNIGAGTITCNYDGINKNVTTVKDNSFIGSNNTLVAPITIEENSYTAAGSVITYNVPHDTLAIGRARQINKEGYAKKLQQRKTQHNSNENSPFIAATKTDSTITRKRFCNGTSLCSFLSFKRYISKPPSTR